MFRTSLRSTAPRRLWLSLALLSLGLTLQAAPAIAAGRWSGSLDFGQGKQSITLRVLAQGGLLDLPEQRLFGYPLSTLKVDGARISFTLFEGQGPGGDQGNAPMLFSGEATTGSDGVERIEGTVSSAGTVDGRFDLEPAALPPGPGESPYSLDTGRGLLPGTLLVPEGRGPFPLVILLAGAGTTDRDGNNYAVPGTNDAIKYLARALGERGVASLRYDKRGSGEAYALVPDESGLRFDDYVLDASAAVDAMRRDSRFSRILLAGHTEGALVASGALRLGNEKRVDGLVLLCASGRSAVDLVQSAVDEAPPELKAEGAAIMAAIKAGKSYPAPSAYFADFFRPSFQPYLASWFRHDLAADLAAITTPVLMIQGNHDAQTTLAEFDILVRARPDAAAYVLPGMNHALKEVGPDMDENYRAFTDPTIPLATDLADLVAAFAAGEALPYPEYRYTPTAR
ncbi:MAG TPA: alpha/beta hydrolase [Rectinemataceae bacterium]|nr:alpha/beta hydrolase [Rectinemataceae bacterium]